MTVSLTLDARIRAALDLRNMPFRTTWDDEPPPKDGMIASARCIAPVRLQHLYQLFLELEEDSLDFDVLEYTLRKPYERALCIVTEHMQLLVGHLLDDRDNTSWIITENEMLYEYQPAETKAVSAPRKRERPDLRLVSSKP